MKQVLIIHGGTSFSSYAAYRTYLDKKVIDIDKLTTPIRWKENLGNNLPGYQVIYPSMPNSTNAVYDEWVIYFEKLLPLLENDVQILGHSLGAMFLAKYFNGHTPAVPFRRLILVAGGYNDDSNEDLGSFRVSSAKAVSKCAEEVHLIHSKDDPVVPYTELAKFQNDLPQAITHSFDDRGHFTDETFPEILELLKKA